MFFGGVGMLIAAFFLRRLSIWAYGKDGEERDSYDSSKKLIDKFEMGLLILMGLFVIFCSLAP